MTRNLRTLIVLAGAILLVSAGFIIFNFTENNDLDNFKKETNESSKQSLISEQELVPNPIDFNKLKGISKDIIGWIQVPGTVIDYPILQSSNNEEAESFKEDYYIERDMYGKKKKAGSIYIQKYNFSNFSDPNTIIYGHNMANGSMFGSLKKFRNEDFFKKNDSIIIYNENKIATYKIYSAFVHNDRHILSDYDFSKEKGQQEFINLTYNPNTKIKQIRKDIKVTTDDNIITLSTCTNRDEERYLVVAVLEKVQYTK